MLFHIASKQIAAANLLESRAAELIGNPTAQAIHAQMLDWIGRTEEAEEYYREAIDLDPNSGLCHLGLSRLLEEQGPDSEAKVHAKRARVLMTPGNYRIWMALTKRDKGPAGS